MKRGIVVGMLGAVCFVSVAQAAWTDIDFSWGGHSFTAVAKVKLSAYNGNSSSGGAFSVDLVEGDLKGSIYAGQAGPINNLFTTWCVEDNRGVSLDGTEYYVTIDQMVYGGGSSQTPNWGGFDKFFFPTQSSEPRAISAISEWIYDQWRTGNLGAYEQEDISEAIWEAQGQKNGVANDLYNLALGQVGTGDATHTWAMNLWTRSENQNLFSFYNPWCDKQSQMITVGEIPAPGAIVLGSLGMVMVGWLRRRHFS